MYNDNLASALRIARRFAVSLARGDHRLMDAYVWIPSLLGALVGAATPSLLQRAGTRRNRLEDAYAEWVGACKHLLTMSTWPLETDADARMYADAMVRFNTAQARVLLHEHSESLRNEVVGVSHSVDDLFVEKVPVDARPATTEERFAVTQQRMRMAERIQAQVVRVVGLVREARH
jgi:hypothetical protein